MSDFLLTLRDRIRCKVFRIHGPACRGREDHTDYESASKIIDPDRWRP